jgi:hypothetical protein
MFALNSFHKTKQPTELIVWKIAKRLLEALKRPKLWLSNWILHDCNAPDHKTLSVKQFLAENRLLKWNTHPMPLI